MENLANLQAIDQISQEKMRNWEFGCTKMELSTQDKNSLENVKELLESITLMARTTGDS